MRTIRFGVASVAVLLLWWTGAHPAFAQKNVVQPGDPIIASSANSPGSEGVANAIDGTKNKYLNFDSANDAKPSGFVVTPSVGPTLVTGIAILSANDAPDRDPKSITLEGSNDDTIADFNSGNWTEIVAITDIPAWTAVFPGADRYQTQTFYFDNYKPYKHYRWTVLKTQGPSTCCMQVAEVQLLGTTLPKNIVQPGDPVIASSANSPGSEGVANAIDGTKNKYLNFDSANDAKPSGFIVTPSVGPTLVTGIAILSANDAPDRDPKSITLEGSNDETIADFNSGNWTQIVAITDIPAWTTMFPGNDRYQTQTFFFPNYQPYKHYRWTVLKTQGPSTCCMQVAEVQLLGTGAPKNVVQPGDPIIASSANSPGSEGVANAIDGTKNKYLNFDSANDAKPSGFVVTPSVGPTAVIGLAMLSANDAPDRDPKSVTLEGSNDDTIESFTSGNWELVVTLSDIPSWTATFPGADRYQTQTFYFPNKKSYKHYRWTVLRTQGPSTCCMQIAEVQLLAATAQTDCAKAAFLLQPVDTPVLEGARATFFVKVNGPWPLQWYLNETNAIPGATGTSYTTEPVTKANADNVYSVQIVGCAMSTPVKAFIFTPSTTRSIGVSFVGGGANGAPTYVLDTDIAGIQLQAYWNNATNANGYTGDGVNIGDVLLDSSGKDSGMTFEYATSGTWGAGTGDASPTARVLNGLVGGNAPGEVSTCTFHGVPGGSHSVIVYAVSPPLQFQVVKFTVGSTSYYMRSMTADEYNATPGFYRGLSTDVNNPTVGDFVRFDNVQPVGGDVAVSAECLTPGYDRNTGINAIQLVLNAPSPGAPPGIVKDPQPTVAPANGTVVLSVQATGDNLTYQWRKNEFGNVVAKAVVNGGNVRGADTATLTISPFTEADAGVYSVAVFNPAGSVISRNASVSVSKYNIQDALVGYWNFDETSGSSAANSAPNGKPAVVNGTSSWVKGLVGNAFSFDGGTYLLVDDYTKATKQISGSAWVNLPAGTLADMVVFRNAQGELTVSGGAARIVGQFELRFNYDENTGIMSPMAAIGIGPNVSRVTGAAGFPTGGWHHVAFTADGAQLRLYVDGTEVGFGDYLADINPPDIKYISFGVQMNHVDPADPTSELGPDPTTPDWLSGQLDEVALWTRVLSADEVAKLNAAGKAGQPLTTIVEQPPVTEPGKLSVSLSEGNVTVTWDKGTLETAPAVTGPWTPNSAAKSPLTEPASDAAKFYRTVSQ
jgi:hypothetical protein